MSKKPRATREPSKNDGDVGYGQPPVKTRFKAGVSGNPKGRPKHDESGYLDRLLKSEIYRPVRVNQNGVVHKIPTLQAGIRNLMLRAAKGEPAAIAIAIKLAEELNARGPATARLTMTREEQVTGILALLNAAKQRKDAHLARQAKQKDSH